MLTMLFCALIEWIVKIVCLKEIFTNKEENQ